MLDFIVQHLGDAISALVGGVAGWLFSRRKQQQEVFTSELDNVDKAVRIYREMIEDLGVQLKQAITELNEAKRTIRDLEATIEALTTELTKYKQLNGKGK